jgi:hypothetical protein
MNFFHNLLSRFRGDESNPVLPRNDLSPPPQAELVSSSFLRYSRDFYDAYEDIQELVSGQHHDLDNAVLFESMSFFMFILDFDLFHSNQHEKVNDYIFLLCEKLVVQAYSGYQVTSFGSPQLIHESIQHRIQHYSESLQKKGAQKLSSLFSGWHNPVTNFMEAARGSDIISTENAPLVIGNIFEKVSASKALVTAYISTVCPFHFGLRELFRDNENFLVMSEQEVHNRLSRGAAEAHKLLENEM